MCAKAHVHKRLIASSLYRSAQTGNKLDLDGGNMRRISLARDGGATNGAAVDAKVDKRGPASSSARNRLIISCLGIFHLTRLYRLRTSSFTPQRRSRRDVHPRPFLASPKVPRRSRVGGRWGLGDDPPPVDRSCDFGRNSTFRTRRLATDVRFADTRLLCAKVLVVSDPQPSAPQNDSH